MTLSTLALLGATATIVIFKLALLAFIVIPRLPLHVATKEH